MFRELAHGQAGQLKMYQDTRYTQKITGTKNLVTQDNQQNRIEANYK